MDFLRSYIGSNINVSLTEHGKEEELIKTFFPSQSNDKFISSKLVGVDSIGVWLEAFGYATKTHGDDGNLLPPEQQTTSKMSVNVLVRYEFIKGIAVTPIESKVIGFQ